MSAYKFCSKAGYKSKALRALGSPSSAQIEDLFPLRDARTRNTEGERRGRVARTRIPSVVFASPSTCTCLLRKGLIQIFFRAIHQRCCAYDPRRVARTCTSVCVPFGEAKGSQSFRLVTGFGRKFVRTHLRANVQ